MLDMTEEKDEIIGFGNPLVSWEVDEYEKHDRPVRWYIFVSVIAVGLIIYALFTANFLFAVIILMIGIISYLSGFREPRRLSISVTDNGLVVGKRFYPYKDIKNFSVIYEPPEVKVLYIDCHSVWHPLLSIPLEQVDPNDVREAMLPYLIENLERTEETLTDLISRVYKL